MFMDEWDWVLLVVAAHLAVLGLVRMMIARRDRLLQELRRHAEQARVVPRDPQPPGKAD